MSKISIYTIATNKYFDYWKKMVISADKYLFLYDEITFHVFTNAENQRIDHKFNRVKIKYYWIPNIEWPLATLNRYKYVYEYGVGDHADVIMHIDADMLVVPHKSLPVIEMLNNKSVALVSHPGYWREAGFERIKIYARNIKLSVKDFILIIKYGNVGTWCRMKNSQAYVKRRERKEYLCGAVWFGEKNAILNLARELARLTQIDLLGGTIPKWNDESYLNYWASKNDYTRINPSFCFDEDYKHLENINPIIIAINKNKNET